MPNTNDPEARPRRPETDLDTERLESGGGLHYQQARREPGGSDEQPTGDAPDTQQAGEHFGGPPPDDEAWLQDQGYPKLGPKLQSRVTQHEHGPYAAGSQQGDTKTPEQAEPPSRR